MVVGIILIIVILIFIILYNTNINFFVKGFRFINNLDPKHVKLGEYKDKVLDIKEEVFYVECREYPSVSFRKFSPNYDFDKLPVIVFIHGGGWVGGSSKKIKDFTKLLSSNGYIVISVDYSLAPEYPYPVSTYQLVEVLNYLFDNKERLKIDINNIFIGGTSAGAHLSSQLGCLITNLDYRKQMNAKLKISKIKGLLLINGVYNLETASKSKFPGIKHFCSAYLGEKNYVKSKKIKEVSTINHINNNYPSIFITAGDKDPLRYQSYELVEVLKKNNIDFKDKFFDKSNLNHDFIYLLNKEKVKDTYEEMIKYINSKINNN
ncbi:MAG: alpha/beta hydrolase fold domain-containing protein [Bacilli bacterium]|nr:alpha/beta hydrolase fold domain-containing protein [Bacilli bacterium]